ncbi:HEPACAM family member 2-like protein [Aix galericulata]|nr:HEPACAM family member 2-like protein [Aix galericulata]
MRFPLGRDLLQPRALLSFSLVFNAVCPGPQPLEKPGPELAKAGSGPRGLLVPLQQAAEAEGALQRRVVVVGSSVLLAGPADAVHIHSARWEYLNGSVSRAIVQYDEGSHYVAIHPPYVGRALFHPPNGSLVLEDLQESDSGIYKVTINLAERESLKVLLDVLSEWWAREGGAG